MAALIGLGAMNRLTVEIMQIEGKRILIAGFGRTGRAVAEFLRDRDCSFAVSEANPESDFPDARKDFPYTEFEFGGHQVETFLRPDLIILSPGIPDTIAPLVEAKKKRIRIVSEIELAFHFLQGTLIAITGTNGKSTTTELTGAMLQSGGKRAYVCGNIGTPIIHFCKNSKPKDFYVAEISSFQLETIEKFRPHIAAIINLAEDHLDRYPTVDPYYQAKMRIFENQSRSDFAVVNYDDAYLRTNSASIPSNLFWFSRKEIPPSGIYARDGLIRVVSGMSVVNFSLGALKGVHNLENTLTAASISLLCGIPPKDLQRAIENFRSLPHRMELVKEWNGISFYDDSKATNVDAVLKSVQSFPGNIHLILGGKDKGCDYRLLRDLIQERVKHLLLIGEAAGRIDKELGDVRKPQFFGSLQDAVAWSVQNAGKGDVVLLSPACSSFDMFANYAERGRVFREAVEANTN